MSNLSSLQHYIQNGLLTISLQGMMTASCLNEALTGSQSERRRQATRPKTEGLRMSGVRRCVAPWHVLNGVGSLHASEHANRHERRV
jgi:hypothetical protein